MRSGHSVQSAMCFRAPGASAWPRAAGLIVSAVLTSAYATTSYSQVPNILPLAGAGCAVSPVVAKGSFDVGPGQRYTELQQIPWLSLRSGDVVNIYYRAEPYR